MSNLNVVVGVKKFPCYFISILCSMNMVIFLEYSSTEHFYFEGNMQKKSDKKVSIAVFSFVLLWYEHSIFKKGHKVP